MDYLQTQAVSNPSRQRPLFAYRTNAIWHIERQRRRRLPSSEDSLGSFPFGSVVLISLSSGTVEWLWNLRPGNEAPNAPAQPTKGPQRQATTCPTHYLSLLTKALLSRSCRAPIAPPGREPKTVPAWPRPSPTDSEQRAAMHNSLDPTPSREDPNLPLPWTTPNATRSHQNPSFPHDSDRLGPP